MFERAINGYDIATGQTTVGRDYVTEGEAKSTYREGNSTIRFGGGLAGQATTYAAQQSAEDAGPGGSGSGGNRKLGEVDGSVGLVPLNGTRPPKLGGAPHGGGKVVGLANPELKLKVEQLVHISQKKKRRRRKRGVRGDHFQIGDA